MYSPRFYPPNDLAGLINALREEFNNIAQAQYDRRDVLELPILYAEPKKPRDGTVAYADGVTWNPTGTGGGFVGYSGGAWVDLE